MMSKRGMLTLGLLGCLPAGMPSSFFLVLGEMEVACSASLSPPSRKCVMAPILPLFWFPQQAWALADQPLFHFLR